MAERNPYYDGRTVYCLQVSQLRMGDIVLTRNRQSLSKMGRKQSAVIAIVGASNFSHAAICSQPPTLIEAIGPGVSTLSIANSFYHAEIDVRVLRYNDESIARRAGIEAGLFLGKGYSVAMAVKSVLPAAADASMRIAFCTVLLNGGSCNSDTKPQRICLGISHRCVLAQFANSTSVKPVSIKLTGPSGVFPSRPAPSSASRAFNRAIQMLPTALASRGARAVGSR